MGKRKIEKGKPIQNKNYRKATFSKRRNGMFRKATDLCRLTGAEIAIIAFSPGDKPFRFGHPSADIVINRYLGLPTSCATTDEEGKRVEKENGCPGSTSGTDDGYRETAPEEKEEGIEELGLAIKDDEKSGLQVKILKEIKDGLVGETKYEVLEKTGEDTLLKTGGDTLLKTGRETFETLKKIRGEIFETLEKTRFETLKTLTKFKDEMLEQTEILEETKTKIWWDFPVDKIFGVDELKNYRRCLQQLRENLCWKLGDKRMRRSCTKDYLGFVTGL